MQWPVKWTRTAPADRCARILLAQSLCDCYQAGGTFPFVAVILDCLTDVAKSFYRRWDFEELPGHLYRLFVSHQQLEAMMSDE